MPCPFPPPGCWKSESISLGARHGRDHRGTSRRHAHTAFRTQIKEEDILALIDAAPVPPPEPLRLNIHVTEAIKHLEMLVATARP